MPLTPVEIIALLFVILLFVKLIVLMVNKWAWWAFDKKIYGNPKVASIVFLVLSAIILYYLLQELNIVQIFAAVAFTSMLMAVSVTIYSKEMLSFGEKIMKQKDLMSKSAFLWLIWIVLALWVLKEIFLK